MLVIEKRESVYSLYREGVSLYSLKRRSLSSFHKEESLFLCFYDLCREENLCLFSIDRRESLSSLYEEAVSLSDLYRRESFYLLYREKREKKCHYLPKRKASPAIFSIETRVLSIEKIESL